VDSNGAPDPSGTYTAQCSGSFPDFIDIVPGGYTGSRFILAQGYPQQPQVPKATPWKGLPFRTVAGVDAYLSAVRGYIYSGMIPADWVAQNNTVEPWFHVPWMTAGNNPRELARGVTGERQVRPPELGLKLDAGVHDVAVGYYNSVGGFTIGRVWANPAQPDPTLAQFAEGTVVAKVLFTSAACTDFVSADACPFDDQTPTWQVHVAPLDPMLTTVRLLQMDVAVKDSDAAPSGWIFGTFAYDKSLTGTGWNKMAPVGLMWGDDPTLIPDGGTTQESVISDQAPKYASAHLGWAGRLNGPVDNPISSCLSCHGTAQAPVLADIIPSKGCNTPSQKLIWFRDFNGQTPFGHVDQKTCVKDSTPSTALDLSLQLDTALKNLSAQNDAGAAVFVNPCTPAPATMAATAPSAATRHTKISASKAVLAAQQRYDTGR
jgi:hypothetical protein